MPLYWDASAFVKHYKPRERGASVVRQLLQDPAKWNGFVVCELLEAEVASLLWRERRGMRISASGYREAVRHFQGVMLNAVFVVQLRSSLLDEAVNLINETREVTVEGCDSLHLAAAVRAADALKKGPVVVVSSDKSLKEAARANGLGVFDPMHQQVDELREQHELPLDE